MSIDRDRFIAAYVEAIFFTDTGEEGQPASDAELAGETFAELSAECDEFIADCGALLVEACERGGYTDARAGHDFWLTRNGHGVGFWDRDELEDGGLGDKLAAIAKAAGERWLYEGDDGLLYLSA